ncbi:MAG: MBL fold metallo-hydrolase [Peptococcaceae bacterium]|nr:MBL fold metallo-hydrolase [Peptococcaceae bacterium]
MKINVKRVLLIAIIALVVLGAGLLLYTYYPMLVMNPTETGPIPDTQIYAIKNKINSVYFVQTNSGYIMIDAGSDAPAIETSLNEAGIDVQSIKWILLTHSDYDHVSSLPLFPNAQIYMSEDELGLINETVQRSVGGGNSVPGGIKIEDINLLQDGQELVCDETSVKAIKAPGHTSGSMVYLIDDKYVFTGDAFRVSQGKISVHPYSMDEDLSKQTMENLKETIDRSSLVLTSHYGYYEKLKWE